MGERKCRTFPVSSIVCLSLVEKPVIRRFCKAPPITISGTKARTSKVSCQENTKPMMIPVPSDAIFWNISPIRTPVAPCTADASVAKRVHNAPVLFFGSSKKAISCRNVARNAFERSRFVNDSPEQAKRKLCRNEYERKRGIREECQILVYLQKGGCEHENSEANEEENVEKNPIFLHVFVTFLENLWKHSERNAHRSSNNTYCSQFTQDNTERGLYTSVAHAGYTSNNDEPPFRSVHLEHYQCGVRFFLLKDLCFSEDHPSLSLYLLLLLLCWIILLAITSFHSILSVQCRHNRGC